VWSDTVLTLPQELAERTWTCALTGRTVAGGTGDDGIAIAEILATFPVALLLSRAAG